MGLIDIILFPIYVMLFALLFAARRRRIQDPVLKKYHLIGFWIKVFSTVAYIIFSVYLSKGDSTYLYYPEGMNITRLIFKDLSNIKLLFISGKDFDVNLLADTLNSGYFESESNYFVTRLVTIFSFFTFGSYNVITLIFSMISFSGVWRLYKFFYEQYPHLHKQFAIAIIYLPTFVFWSSGILKDPLCTGMLGWFTYSVYKAFIQKQSIGKNIFIAVVTGYILALVKAYILVSYLPFFALFIVLTYLKNIKQLAVRLVLVVLVLFASIGGFVAVQGRLQEELGGLAIDKLTESVQNSQQNFMRLSDLAESSFTLGVDFDGSFSSLVKIAPAGVVATLFRPYLWESKKLSTFLSSVESLCLMLFTIFVFVRAGPFLFFGSIVKNPMVMYCLLFAVLFALFVGVTTLNFGTLVRYKIPCMPFYVIGLVLILERRKEKKLARDIENANNELQSEKATVSL
jgi:hypothetical protein